MKQSRPPIWLPPELLAATSGLSAAARLVLGMLIPAHRPSVKQLATWLRLSDNTVSAAIEELERRKLLSVERTTKLDANQRRPLNRYKTHVKAPWYAHLTGDDVTRITTAAGRGSQAALLVALLDDDLARRRKKPLSARRAARTLGIEPMRVSRARATR
jgi:DNA-binding transcriptional MocR family regulator